MAFIDLGISTRMAILKMVVLHTVRCPQNAGPWALMDHDGYSRRDWLMGRKGIKDGGSLHIFSNGRSFDCAIVSLLSLLQAVRTVIMYIGVARSAFFAYRRTPQGSRYTPK